VDVIAPSVDGLGIQAVLGTRAFSERRLQRAVDVLLASVTAN
jgi:hypothetical protein